MITSEIGRRGRPRQRRSPRGAVGVAALALAMFASACSSGDTQSEDLSSAEVSTPVTTAAEVVTGDDGDATSRATTTSTAAAPSAPDASTRDITSDPNAAYRTGHSGLIYDQDVLHTFEIDISADDLEFLDADPAAEEYAPAVLTFAGESLEVGLRYKGSIGAFVGCLDGPSPFEPSGRKTCTKLSMKVKLNWNDSGDEFYGLRKLQFHSMNNDPSQMRERLGYHLFAEMGVPSPRSTHARVIINGEYSGLYALTEQIDGRFTRNRFEDGTGNLYKEVWPVDVDGEVQTDEVYSEGLRTNENDPPDHAIIRGFAEELTQAQSAGTAAVFDRWMDVDKTLAYAAVDRTIRHDDGPFHWYCFDGCSNHNYFLYADPGEDMLHIIPWDLDNAFENIAGSQNPVTPVADGFGEVTDGCEPFRFGPFGITQRSAACDPVFASWTWFNDVYQRQLRDFIAGPFAADNVEPLIDRWAEQIADATSEASVAHDDAVTLEEFTEAVEELKADLEVARNG